MREGLELESRRRIYDYLTANPGVHLRRIGQALGMSTGMLSYHLGYLERNGLLRLDQLQQVAQLERRPAVHKLREPLVERPALTVQRAAQGVRGNVHMKVLYGRSSHHHVEAVFKAFGRALRVACSRDKQLARTLPSTKGLL